MDELRPLLDDLDAAVTNHAAVYRAAFASRDAFASASKECGDANDRIEAALSALRDEIAKRGWKPAKSGDERAIFYVRAAAMQILEAA